MTDAMKEKIEAAARINADQFDDLENISVSTNSAIWNAISDAFESGAEFNYPLAKAEGRREMLREVIDALDGNDWWTIEESLRERFAADLADEKDGA